MLKDIYYFGKNPSKNLQNLFPDTYSGAKYYNSLMKLNKFFIVYKKRYFKKKNF